MTTPATFPAHAPVVTVTRGQAVESVHFGSLVVLDAHGGVVRSQGDPEAMMFGRSALKPLQALAMLRAGFAGNPHQVTLACASHSGEQAHLAVVKSTLADAGLTEADLLNTPDLPFGQEARKVATLMGEKPSSLYQNCSGKHAAMLATCVANGWPTDTYLNVDHPLQQLILQTAREVTGEEPAALTVDGCGAPVFGFSLTGLARLYGHIAKVGSQNPASPEGRIYFGITQNPELLGGTDRDVTDEMLAFTGLMTKDGAEAVQAGAFADGSAFALKIADGTDRARSVLGIEALKTLGRSSHKLEKKHTRAILGHGKPVGALHPVR